jgi:hypothetical protein
MITYIRTTPFPKCCKCKKQLDFYLLGHDENTYLCNDCQAKDIVDKLIGVIRKMLNSEQSPEESDTTGAP